jgi:hypothetical protein
MTGYGCAAVGLHAAEADPGATSAARTTIRKAARRIARQPTPARARARSKTESSIGSVSLPVNVFCWLG